MDKSIQDFTANQIVNVELPFLDELDTDKLMSIRSNDSSVFQNFRLELEKHCRELRSISDSKLIEQKMQNIFHELNDVQGQKIQQKISSLHRQMKLSTAIGLAGLATSFVTGGLRFLLLLQQSAKVLKTIWTLRIRFKKIRITFFGKARSNPDDHFWLDTSDSNKLFFAFHIRLKFWR